MQDDEEVADFRSDTLTQPTREMRQAMAEAEVGDDVLGEDPTVRALEVEAAAYLGKEAALFVPSGTMANQVAIHVHCRPGDELICEARSHVLLYEAGGMARWSGTLPRIYSESKGFLDPARLPELLRSDDTHYPRSRLLWIENTHNMAGGRVLDPKGMQELVRAAKAHGLLVHVDGARLANAAVACGCDAAELASGADSVTLCFSKGLGAPVGSVVAGSARFVHEARRVRKALGGGMRQAGILAAAARIALQQGPALLSLDHERAKRMAAAFADLPGLELDLQAVESNILMLDLQACEAQDLLQFLESRNIRAMAVGPRRLRFVLHRDLGHAQVERCIQELTAWARSH